MSPFRSHWNNKLFQVQWTWLKCIICSNASRNGEGWIKKKSSKVDNSLDSIRYELEKLKHSSWQLTVQFFCVYSIRIYIFIYIRYKNTRYLNILYTEKCWAKSNETTKMIRLQWNGHIDIYMCLYTYRNTNMLCTVQCYT